MKEILQHIAVWSLILLLAGMSWTAIIHNYRRKRRQRRNQDILRNRYY